MTFWLEKYRTDRTWFGTTRLQQGGRWTMLYPGFLPLLIGVLTAVLTVAATAFLSETALWGLVFAVPLTIYGWVNYRVQSFRLLTNTKTAEGIGFVATPRRWRVLRIYILGNILIALTLALVLFTLVVGLGVLLSQMFIQFRAYIDIFDAVQSLPTWASAGIGAAVYFTFFIFWGVLTHTFLTLPLMRHYVETLRITGAPGIASIRQRDRDAFAEAEGFAEALDVGAAI